MNSETFEVGSMHCKDIRKEITVAIVFHSYYVSEGSQDRECTI